MLRFEDKGSQYEYLVPDGKVEPTSSYYLAKKAAGLLAIALLVALNLQMFFGAAPAAATSAAVVLAAAPAPPHFAYCKGKDCESDEKVQKETWAWAPTCGSGLYQAPIDIVTADVATAPALDGGISVEVGQAQLTPSNTGHNFQLTNTVAGPHAVLRGEKFNFAQVHFHAPSENTIDGQSFAMEGHYVFQRPGDPYAGTTNALAVIGVLFDESPECNANLDTFWALPPIDTAGPAKKNVTGAGVQALIGGSLLGGAYYQFTGSLTTPPCTEGVAWHLLKARATVCTAQLDRLRQGLAAVQDGASINNRKTQDLHQRIVSQTSDDAGP